MILIDTSAWIEFLRDTGSGVSQLVDDLLAEDIAVCGVVRMEVLAGARDEAHLSRLRGLLARAVTIQTLAVDYEDAAMLYRQCRGQGETVRKLPDCLIAASAIRESMPVLHSDVDFEVLARHTDLRVYGD